MENRKTLLLAIAIIIVVVLLSIIIYDYQNWPVWIKGPSPAPLIYFGGGSLMLFVGLTIVLFFLIRKLRKK